MITVAKLSKQFKIHRREAGFFNSIKGLFVRHYNIKKAVEEISFEIEQGELVGFIGPNGAGKTTTLKMLSGLLHPSSGSVRVLGHNPFKREPKFQRQFALVMGQKSQLWWDLPPIDTYELNKAIYGVSDIDFQSRLDELVSMLGAGEIIKTQTRKLSLGERMKCELIASLLHQPKVLFLDEPTIGLDLVVQAAIRDFIKEYNRKYNATIILTSHYMSDVEALCERVIIIDNGKIYYDGPLKDLVKNFADHKNIEVDLKSNPSSEQLAKLKYLVSKHTNHLKFLVPKSEISEVTAGILANFSVVDLSITEPEIEEIIREIFSHNV